LAVEQQYLEAGPRCMVGDGRAAWTRSDNRKIIPFDHISSSQSFLD
jgi:hypothetical protein